MILQLYCSHIRRTMCTIGNFVVLFFCRRPRVRSFSSLVDADGDLGAEEGGFPGGGRLHQACAAQKHLRIVREVM